MISGRAAFFGGSAVAIIFAGYITLKIAAYFLSASHDVHETFVSVEVEHDAYDRRRFGTWIDVDGDCLDTRNEILLLTSSTEVRLGNSGCRVKFGIWFDAYSGSTMTDAAKIDIDHVVSLNFAWRAGASRWSDAERSTFANDPENLILTSYAINRSKGSLFPSEWLPPNKDFRCAFVQRFLMISERYKLNASKQIQDQTNELRNKLCQ